MMVKTILMRKLDVKILSIPKVQTYQRRRGHVDEERNETKRNTFKLHRVVEEKGTVETKASSGPTKKGNRRQLKEKIPPYIFFN